MKIKWTGPFQIKDYLAAAIDRTAAWQRQWPPERDAVYIVTRKHWTKKPAEAAEPLYVGGNTGGSARFCTRVGDLIADMHGFFGKDTGHHSGGITLWSWCHANRVHPGELWLGWANSGENWCARCAEKHLFNAFPRAIKGDFTVLGLRNKVAPPRCPLH